MHTHKLLYLSLGFCLVFLGQVRADEEATEEEVVEGPDHVSQQKMDRDSITKLFQLQEESKDPMAGKLKIDVVYKPKDCPEKTDFGLVLHMKYAGYLRDGSKFDSSYDRGKPFIFELGAGQAIKGWEQGLHEMCVGEKRKLIIPPHLAYGDRGAGEVIPPSATLYMLVELEAIREGSGKQDKRQPELFDNIDANEDGELTPEEVSDYILKNAGEDEVEEEDHDQVITEIFQSEDRDKDGVITREEFFGPQHDEL